MLLCAESLLQFSSVAVVSNSLWPHGLQYTRPPCPSPIHGVYSNSCPLSQWCHPTISSSVSPSPPTFNLSQHQGLFKWVHSSHQVDKYWSFSFSISPSNEYSGLISLRMDTPYMTTGKTTAFTRQTFLGKVMSLLFNMLSRLVIAFLPRSKHLLISRLQLSSAVIFGAQENKVSHYFHCFPIYLPWSDGTRCQDLSFLNVEF